MFSAFASLVFHTELTILELTSKYALYPNGNRNQVTIVGVPY